MKKVLADLKGHLMSGISFVLPLIIGASLVVAIPKMIALGMGITSLDPYAEAEGFKHALYLIEQVGWTGIGLINTVLAGFIAYSIGDKAALVILPLIATMSVAIVMGALLSEPLAWINTSLVDWIRTMIENDVNKILLAIIMGAMIGSDLGGPVNKAAWMAGNVLLAEDVYLPAIIVNVAICAVPFGYALATLFHKKRFNNELLDAGRNNFIMGFIGITEGAIPFTLVNPLRLVPINMLGGAIASGLGIALGMYAKMPPVGGIYGFFTVGNGWAYLIGLFVGAAFIGFVAPLFVNFNKQEEQTDEVKLEDIDISFEN